MLTTQQRDSGPRLQETAEVALGNVLSAVEKAIDERRELDDIFNSLNTPKMVSANTIAALATPEANKNVDQKAGGVGNAFGPRLYVQSLIAQRSNGLTGPNTEAQEPPGIVAGPLDSFQSAEPVTARGLTEPTIALPRSELVPIREQGLPIFTALKTPQDHLAALLAAIRPADQEQQEAPKRRSLTGLAA